MSVLAGLEFAKPTRSIRRWVTPVTVSAGLLVLTTAIIWLVDPRLK